jgi:hypothetical protein
VVAREIPSSDIGELHRLRQLALRPFILLEPRHRRSLILRQIALRIDGRLAAPRRRERQFDARVSEDEIRGRKLFEPKPRLATSVAQSIVGRYYHHDLHVSSETEPHLLYTGHARST